MKTKGAVVEDLPLKEQAYLHLKRLILSEEVPMNSFLSERGLAERLGMSKTPIRLAIERLENEGFVRVSPQQGIVVVALSFEDILDSIDYRLALESFVVEHVAGELGDAQIERLEALLREQSESLHQEDEAKKRTDMVLSDMAYHRLLAEFRGNKQIVQALERQQDMMFRVANRVFQKHPERAEQSYLEHKAIADAVIKGDKTRAAALIREHILRIKALLVGGAV